MVIRRFSASVGSVLLAAVVGLPISSVRGGDDSAEEVIAKAIKNRLAIRSYDIEVAFDYSRGSDRDHDIAAVRYRMDGERLRADLKYPYTESTRFPGLTETHYWLRKIYLSDRTIQLSSMGGRDGSVEIDTDSERVREARAHAQRQHDVRSLGFHGTGVTIGGNVEEYLRLDAPSERTVRKEVLDGVDCFRVSLRLRSGGECDVWLAPSRGYAPIRSRGHTKSPDVTYTEDIRLTVEEWKESGLWFPTRYTSSRKHEAADGRVVEFTEDATIVVHSLNEPLEESVFELAGLEIPVGRKVRTLPSSGRHPIWNGKEVVPSPAKRTSQDGPAL